VKEMFSGRQRCQRVKMLHRFRDRLCAYLQTATNNLIPCRPLDSGGICETSGNDSMCDSKQKSSYEHGSDFERLRSYDRLKLRIEGNDY